MYVFINFYLPLKYLPVYNVTLTPSGMYMDESSSDQISEKSASQSLHIVNQEAS